MRKTISLTIVLLLCTLALSVGQTVDKTDSSVKAKLNLEARKQAELCLIKGREAFLQEDYVAAADYFEKGVGIVADSGDALLAIHPLATELFVHAFVTNETLGMVRLRDGLIDNKTEEGFKKTLTMLSFLDKNPNFKKEIDASLPAEKKLNDFVANCYWCLGMIYDGRGDKDVKNECIQKLRALGKDNLAVMVEKGYKANFPEAKLNQ